MNPVCHDGADDSSGPSSGVPAPTTTLLRWTSQSRQTLVTLSAISWLQKVFPC